MITIIEWLDLLAGLIPTLVGRIVISAVGILIIATIAIYLRHRRQRDPVRDPFIELFITFVLAGGAVIVIGIIVGIWGLAPLIERALDRSGIGRDTIGRIILTIAVLFGAYLLAGFFKRVIAELVATQEAVSDHQREITYRVTQIIVYIAAVFIAIGFWPVDLSGFLIGAGVLGIIIGYAARQTLSSILSGFVLMFSRPFEIGDWIAIEDREGIVTDITTVNTRIQTFDGEYVIIPNDVVSSQTITNRTRKGRLRLRVEVGVDYDTDLDHAQAVIKESLIDIDEIMSVPTPQVVLAGFGESAILFEIKFWIDNPSSRRRWRAIQAVVKNVREAFRREGIKIPFPQREITGRKETGGFRIRSADIPMESPEPIPPDGDDP